MPEDKDDSRDFKTRSHFPVDFLKQFKFLVVDWLLPFEIERAPVLMIYWKSGFIYVLGVPYQ